MDGTVGTISGVARLRGEQRWRRVLHLAPELLAILACVAVIWAAVAFTLWQANVAAVESARRETVTLARAFAESSERISTVLDRELLALRASFAEKGDAFNLVEWARTQSSPDHLTLQIVIANGAGVAEQATQGSLPSNGQHISIADREHFRVHLDPERDSLFISKPVIGRLSDQCSVQYSRKLLDRGGHFAGVGVDSMSCEDLSHFYEASGIGDGFVMLVGLDGVIRGFGPSKPNLLGSDIGKVPAYAPALTLPEGTLTAAAPWDNRPGSSVFAVWTSTIWWSWLDTVMHGCFGSIGQCAIRRSRSVVRRRSSFCVSARSGSNRGCVRRRLVRPCC
jgi:hypothetical protein